jgi:hypothetical protein
MLGTENFSGLFADKYGLMLKPGWTKNTGGKTQRNTELLCRKQ